MQVYLYQNNQQNSFHLAPYLCSSGSWRFRSGHFGWYEGLDTWYPLNHEKWKALGIVAPAPIPKVEKTEAQTK